MRYPNVSTEQVPGSVLVAAIDSGYLNRLFPTYIADSPDAAVARIEQRFGDFPTQNGNNIEGIIDIRDSLYRVAEDARFSHATVITIPHTHWSEERPIILRNHGEDYIVGPWDVYLSYYYTPISFVFTSEGPLAFEWADPSVCFNVSELADAYRIIRKLNDIVAPKNWPLGISLNFRFKPLYSNVTIATVEFPLEGDPDHSALIVPIERYRGAADRSDVAQVAWHAYSDFLYGLDHDGVMLLRQMRARLSSPLGGQ